MKARVGEGLLNFRNSLAGQSEAQVAMGHFQPVRLAKSIGQGMWRSRYLVVIFNHGADRGQPMAELVLDQVITGAPGGGAEIIKGGVAPDAQVMEAGGDLELLVLGFIHWREQAGKVDHPIDMVTIGPVVLSQG